MTKKPKDKDLVKGGGILKKARIQRGYKTLQSFVDSFKEKTGKKISISAVSNYELGICRLSHNRLKDIIDFLDLSNEEYTSLPSEYFKGKKMPYSIIRVVPRKESQEGEMKFSKPQGKEIQRLTPTPEVFFYLKFLAEMKEELTDKQKVKLIKKSVKQKLEGLLKLDPKTPIPKEVVLYLRMMNTWEEEFEEKPTKEDQIATFELALEMKSLDNKKAKAPRL